MFQAKRQVQAGALAIGLSLGLGVVSVGCSGSDNAETTADAFELQQKELAASDAGNDAAAEAAAKAARKGGR